MRIELRETAVILGCFVAISLITAIWQPRTSLNEGRGWDGEHYYEIAELIQSGSPIKGPAPYVRRPGVPAVVAWLTPPDALLEGFLLVNLAAVTLLVILLGVWLSLWVERPWIRVAVNVAFQAHWLGPVRHIWFYPTFVDPPAMLLSLIFLLVYFGWSGRAEGRALLLGVIAFVSVTVRENLLSLPLALFAVDIDTLWQRGTPLRLGHQVKKIADTALVPFSAGACGLAFVHYVTESTTPWSYLVVVASELARQSPSMWLNAGLSMYGPLLFLPVITLRSSGRFLWQQPILGVWLLAGLVLSYVGGYDTERFFAWLFPVILVLIARSMQKLEQSLKSPLVWVPLLVNQLFALRLFWPTPDKMPCPTPPSVVWLTRAGECVSQAQLLTAWQSPGERSTTLMQFAACFAVLVAGLWWSKRSRRA